MLDDSISRDGSISSEPLDGSPITDAELEELALASDLEAPIPDDAVPIELALLSRAAPTGLASWYMPAVISARSSGWRRPVVIGIVGTLVVLEALGLCSVFGQVVIG